MLSEIPSVSPSGRFNTPSGTFCSEVELDNIWQLRYNWKMAVTSDLNLTSFNSITNNFVKVYQRRESSQNASLNLKGQSVNQYLICVPNNLYQSLKRWLIEHCTPGMVWRAAYSSVQYKLTSLRSVLWFIDFAIHVYVVQEAWNNIIENYFVMENWF